jgi:bacillithiol system protein YtxJ
MHPQLTRLDRVEELTRLLDASQRRPQLVFKHSFSCGISAEALDEIIAHLDESRRDVDYAMVTVQSHRDLSNAVARELGVRHETPQALLIVDGRVVWTASHFRVTAKAVGEAISAAATSPAPGLRPTPTTTPTES